MTSFTMCGVYHIAIFCGILVPPFITILSTKLTLTKINKNLDSKTRFSDKSSNLRLIQIEIY